MSLNKRARLQSLLERTMQAVNLAPHVYFQPPESVKLKYPCIVFEREPIRNTSADNLVYMQTYAYTITVMDDDPDFALAEQISRLPMIRHNQHFSQSNLYHDVFTISY